MIDLLVIGAGLSGLVAAVTAAQAGLSVRIIAKGMGALHWSAGTIDVLGYLCNGAQRPVQTPLETAPFLREHFPEHPYARLGPDRIAAALAAFKHLAADIGLPYEGASVAGENLALPSPIGAARPAYFAPLAQRPGDLGQSQPILVVGFRGLRDFYPTLIADNLGKQGHQARAAFLPLPLITQRSDANTVQLARALDDPACRRRLASGVKQLLEPGERVGLPAILGLEAHARVMADLERWVEAPIFEIPTLPPSVPGLRLTSALRRRLEQLGGRVEVGMEALPCRELGAGQSEIAWIETASSSRPLKHRARYFLLATGGILGGGFDSDHEGRVWETIFNLPLTIPQDRSAWFRAQFLDPAGQEVFRGGVRVNRQFQPITDSGQVAFANLWACGSVLAGADAIRERSREGIAVATATAAAQQIVRHHRSR